MQHFEEPGFNIVISSPAAGVVDISSINARKQSFVGNPTQILYQETQGLRLEWNGSDSVYRITLDPDTLGSDSFEFLAFRVGQSIEPNNPQGKEQDFTIEVGDGEKIVSFPASSINKIIYPDEFFPRTVMQTFRISLKDLQAKGLRLNHLTEIRLVFNLIPSGVLYIDELQLSR